MATDAIPGVKLKPRSFMSEKESSFSPRGSYGRAAPTEKGNETPSKVRLHTANGDYGGDEMILPDFKNKASQVVFKDEHNRILFLRVNTPTQEQDARIARGRAWLPSELIVAIDKLALRCAKLVGIETYRFANDNVAVQLLLKHMTTWAIEKIRGVSEWDVKSDFSFEFDVVKEVFEARITKAICDNSRAVCHKK